MLMAISRRSTVRQIKEEMSTKRGIDEIKNTQFWILVGYVVGIDESCLLFFACFLVTRGGVFRGCDEVSTPCISCFTGAAEWNRDTQGTRKSRPLSSTSPIWDLQRAERGFLMDCSRSRSASWPRHSWLVIKLGSFLVFYDVL